MHPLDNPIYSALTSRQSHFAEVNGSARRFIPEISTLAGFESPTVECYAALTALVPEGKTVGIVLDDPPQPMTNWDVLHDIPLLQMVFAPKHAEAPKHEFIELTDADSPEMVALTELTKPGPFGTRTHEFGGYIGIRRNGILAAMSGYRMRMPGYTEISAVCTHPDHIGKGYARSLMNVLISQILASNETPFLHVKASNDRAVQLYERMGFRTRYNGHFIVMRRTHVTD
jgi:predicted GNAT family acetyltransferase